MCVEVSIVEQVVGVPLGGQPQLWVDVDVVGAASLMLNCVDVGHDGVIQSFVVRTCRGACITPTIATVTTDVTNAVLRRCGFIWSPCPEPWRSTWWRPIPLTSQMICP